MKTNLKTIATALLLGVATFVNANVEPAKKSFEAVIIKCSKFPSLNLFIDKQKGVKVDIEVKDENGNVLYDDVIGKNATNYRSKINLENLPKGIYYIEMTEGRNVDVKKVEI
jgi:Secretion system C-terminal sorting domain